MIRNSLQNMDKIKNYKHFMITTNKKIVPYFERYVDIFTFRDKTKIIVTIMITKEKFESLNAKLKQQFPLIKTRATKVQACLEWLLIKRFLSRNLGEKNKPLNPLPNTL